MTTYHSIEETAARWHARADSGQLSREDEQALDAWLGENLRHRLAYAEVAAAGFAVEQASPQMAQRSARRWPTLLGAVAPLLLMVFIFAPHAWQDWRSDMHTSVGVGKSEMLVDGSRLRLDSDSAVVLAFSPATRDLDLVRGALYATVAKDPAHPFRVHCAGVEATAVGTQFAVVRRDAEIEVGVTEGIVAVRATANSDAVQIIAGQRALVSLDHAGIRVDALPATSYGWTRGVLSFDHAPLKNVVADLARYLPAHVILRASHPDSPITATFPIDQPDAALNAIAQSQGLVVRRVAGLITIVEDQ